MQALEDIDLSKNRLSEQIPGFLGQLPNLEKLNLSVNDFSGALPSSIRNNRRLKYDINGNPNVDASGKDESSRATVIGLAVGIPLLLIITILARAHWLIWKQANQGQNQGTGPETGDGKMHGHESSGQEVQTPDYSAPMEPTAEEYEDCVPVDTIDGEPNKQSMVPEMDLDELEELIDKYVNGGCREDHQAEVDTDEECMVVAEYGVAANDDQSMVPDMDLEELDEIIQQRQHRPVN